jgi:hypothetical protein
MKYDTCDICGEELEVSYVDGMKLCVDCEQDYYKENYVEPKFIKFYRTVWAEGGIDWAKWHFKYSVRFMGGRSHSIKFTTNKRIGSIIFAIERTLKKVRGKR